MDPHPPPSWSRLPGDLLLNITNRLHSHIDRLSVRAVCHSWRSGVPPPPRRSTPPLKLPFPVGPSPDLNPRLRGHFDFVESTVYCLQSLKKISDSWKTPKCWLIKIEELPGIVRFKDPLHSYDYYYHNLSPYLPHRLNLLDYRVSEIAKFHELRFESSRKLNIFEMHNEIQPPDIKSIIVKRVAVCSEGAVFAVMTIHTGGHLSIWRMGDRKWTRIKDGQNGVCYNDVVYHGRKFYAVDNSGFTISVDPSLKEATRVTPGLASSDGDGEKRLVSSDGNLFLLGKDSHPMDVFLERYDVEEDKGALPTFFHVYKLDLGNRAVIVCDMCTFSGSAQDVRGCKMNCIYFSVDCFCGKVDDDKDPGIDAAMYDMEDDSSSAGVFWTFLASPILDCES